MKNQKKFGALVLVLFGMMVLFGNFASASDVYFSCEIGPFVDHSDHGFYTVFAYDNPELSGEPLISEEVHFYNSKTWYAYNRARCASRDWFEIGESFYGSHLCTEEIIDDRCVDHDGDNDGYDEDVDCDDEDASVWNFFSGYLDADLDNYGVGNLVDGCYGDVYPEDIAGNNLDCDDNDASVNPGAEEICGDGIDNDCSGGDEECEIIACSEDIDCRPSYWINDSYHCSSGDVYLYFVAPECFDAGTVDSYCSYDLVLSDLFEVCDFGCSSGFCNDESDDAIAPVVDLLSPFGGQVFYGASYLVDFVFRVDDQSDVVNCSANVSGDLYPVYWGISKVVNNSVEVNLSEGDYSVVIFCTDVFGNWGNSDEVLFSVEELEVCSVDGDCSDDYSEERYCSGDDVYETFHDFSCVSGDCVESVSERFVRECNRECDDGRCTTNGGGDDGYDETFNEVNYYSGSSSVVRNVGAEEILIGGSDEGEGFDFLWIWVLLLVLGILFLVLMIFYVMRG